MERKTGVVKCKMLTPRLEFVQVSYKKTNTKPTRQHPVCFTWLGAQTLSQGGSQNDKLFCHIRLSQPKQ